MKRAALVAAAVLLISACGKAPVAYISGNIDNLGDSSFVLQKFSLSRLQPVDTVTVDGNGVFSCKVKLAGSDPSFYYLCSGDRSFATVVLLPGDKVSINVKDGDFTVEGSEESAALKEINDEFAKARQEMISNPKEAGKTFVQYKRYAIKRMVTHPRSITSAAIPFQKFNEALPVFTEPTDVIIFKQLYDAIKTVYPTSEYVVALADEIASRQKALELSSKLSGVPVSGFPDLNMPDINGKMQSLSSLTGNVIILSFWSASQADQKMFNITLSDLYSKYHDNGLEIYQVGLDVDKPSWASAVKSQGIRWTSVNDGYGNQSPSISSYNIGTIPALFIINRSGELVARDVFDASALESAIKKLL